MYTLLLLFFSGTARPAPRYPRGYVRSQNQEDLLGKVAQLKPDVSLPRSLDWSKNATTKVKDQGRCGSCWAFSAIQGVESSLFLSTGALVDLSTEELVDCDRRDDGCGGGDVVTASRYLERWGVASSDDYPDESSEEGRAQPCSWNDETVAIVENFQYAVEPCRLGRNCTGMDELDLAASLALYGPLSICVNSKGWDFYTSGIFKESCEPEYRLVDHCVQLVGYDMDAKDDEEPYWKIKNSWGSAWGENGFIRIPFGQGNRCCVACEAVSIQARPSPSARKIARGAASSS